MNASENHDFLEVVCYAVADQLEELAIERCQGSMTEETFIKAVLEIEAREITPHGLTLTASHTLDNWTVFSLKMNGTSESCAAFEFLPQTGEFRRKASHCDS